MVAALGTYLCGSPSLARSSHPSLPNLQSRTTSLSPELVLDQLLPSLFVLSLGQKTRPWCCAATSMAMLERRRRQGSRVKRAPSHSIHLRKTCDAPWAKLVSPLRTPTAPAVSPSRTRSTLCSATVFLTPLKTSQRWHQGATSPRAGSHSAQILVLTYMFFRCGSPSHEAPEPLFTGLPSYSETMATRVGGSSDPDARMDR